MRSHPRRRGGGGHPTGSAAYCSVLVATYDAASAAPRRVQPARSRSSTCSTSSRCSNAPSRAIATHGSRLVADGLAEDRALVRGQQEASFGVERRDGYDASGQARDQRQQGRLEGLPGTVLLRVVDTVVGDHPPHGRPAPDLVRLQAHLAAEHRGAPLRHLGLERLGPPDRGRRRATQRQRPAIVVRYHGAASRAAARPPVAEVAVGGLHRVVVDGGVGVDRHPFGVVALDEVQRGELERACRGGDRGAPASPGCRPGRRSPHRAAGTAASSRRTRRPPDAARLP